MYVQALPCPGKKQTKRAHVISQNAKPVDSLAFLVLKPIPFGSIMDAK